MDLFQSNDKNPILKYDALENEEKSINLTYSSSSHNNSLEENFYTRRLILLEYVSIALTSISFVVFAVLSYEDTSVSAFAFSVDSFLDVLTYIIMIWRFSSENDVHAINKDRPALIGIGFVFLFSALAVEYESVKNLVSMTKPIQSMLFVELGIVETILFAVLAILKFLISTKIEANKTIISDGINSLIAAFAAFSMTIGMTIFVVSPEIWYLDAVFGFFMGLFVFVYGCKLLYDNIWNNNKK